MKGRDRVAIVVLSAFSASTLHASDTQERIEIHSHDTSEVCAGLCVDDTMTISADGRVFWELTDPRTKARSKRFAFRVAPHAAAEFMRQMRAIRPISDVTDKRYCNVPAHFPDVWDWDIHWTGPEGDVHLLTCDVIQTSAAWREAIKAIGMPHGLLSGIPPGAQLLSDEIIIDPAPVKRDPAGIAAHVGQAPQLREQ